MEFFSKNDLGILEIYAGKSSKNASNNGLQGFYIKLHDLVEKSIKDLPCTKEKPDLRTLAQAGGKGKGYVFKTYLWIKIFSKNIPDNLVFFNLTYKKNGELSLCLDFKNNDNVVKSLYENSKKAKEIKKSQENIKTLDLYGKSEDEITNFIKDYINDKLSVIIDFHMALKNQIFVENLSSNYNLILTGAPGTGKTYLARQIAASMIGCNEGELNSSDQFGFVQFHPSYDYTDFVEGLRPEQVGNSVMFKRQDGIFKKFCKEAAKAEILDENRSPKDKRKFVFVIDEINRGEISKIFGELFFSIDPGYRDIDRIPVKTQYQNLIENSANLTDDVQYIENPNYYPFKKGFYVPSNVYVIGTMNDIDRSVESMDFAFRRRFAFYEVKAKETQESILAGSQFKDAAITKMDALNKAIQEQEGFSSAYHIGAAYFKKIDEYSGSFEQLWENHIKGVLFEYLRGLPDAKEILDKWKQEFE